MPVLDVVVMQGKKIPLDEGGYLTNVDDWSEEFAAILAEREGCAPLTDEQMHILRFVRDYYKKFNFFPILHAVCKNVHQAKDCMHEQFPNPLVAWKLAGLPKPEEPVISLLEAGQSPG